MTMQEENDDGSEILSFRFMDDPEYAALVKTIAEECVANMSKKDQKVFRKHPRLVQHHFGYGLYIRNNFYKRFEDAGIMLTFRDGMSRDVLREIRSILMPDYIPPDEWS